VLLNINIELLVHLLSSVAQGHMRLLAQGRFSGGKLKNFWLEHLDLLFFFRGPKKSQA